jgi:hypothetical protein
MAPMRLSALALFLLLISCGGPSGGDRLLHLSGQDETEASFRDRLNRYKKDDSAGFAVICQQARTDAAALAVEALTSGNRGGHVFPNTTPRPEQTALPDDLQRAVDILRDVC